MTAEPGPSVPPRASLADALLGDRLRGRGVRIEFVLAVMREPATEHEQLRRPMPVHLQRIVQDLKTELESVRAELTTPGRW